MTSEQTVRSLLDPEPHSQTEALDYMAAQSLPQKQVTPLRIFGEGDKGYPESHFSATESQCAEQFRIGLWIFLRGGEGREREREIRRGEEKSPVLVCWLWLECEVLPKQQCRVAVSRFQRRKRSRNIRNSLFGKEASKQSWIPQLISKVTQKWRRNLHILAERKMSPII